MASNTATSRLQTPNKKALELRRSRDPVKDACVASLGRITEQLIDLMTKSGVTVQEYCKLVRVRSVQQLASQLLDAEGKVSKSRIAILTGLPRGEVARILRLKDPLLPETPGVHPARKVLSMWHERAQFAAASGDPAILPIFGKRKSFERLVSLASGGLPVRAMLDELVQLNAVEILPGQLVKVRSRIPIHSRLTSQGLCALGERTADLLGTLRGNMSSSEQLFEGTSFATEVSADILPQLRRELEQQGNSFISEAIELLSKVNQRRHSQRPREQKRFRFGVTVFCFQEELTKDKPKLSSKVTKRKNLRRDGSSPQRTRNRHRKNPAMIRADT